jgi:BMFP domain-containing protein YqiC
MTNGSNRLLDDFAKLLTDAAGAAQGVRKEVETALHAQMEKILNSMDVVQRDEFEAVRQMAVKAREENESLSARIAELEKQLKVKSPEGKRASTGKTAPKAASKK